MAKISDITVEIKPTVSEDTALICLRLVELFLNSNSRYWLDYSQEEDGKVHLFLQAERGQTSEFDYKHIDMNKTAAVVHHKNILEIINQQPTADVVQVVRCRDCKFYTFKPQQTSRTTSVRRCNRSAIICTKPDDYCSFGERAKE